VPGTAGWPTGRVGVGGQPGVISDAGALAELLLDTPLAGREIETFELDSGEVIFGVRYEPVLLLDRWTMARRLVDRTGRWPVAASGYRDPSIDTAALVDELGPRASSDTVIRAGERAFADIRAEIASYWPVPFTEYLTFELNVTRHRCGHAPDEAEIRASLPADATELDLDRWLKGWEDAHFPEARRRPATHLDWFTPPIDEAMLMFPPVAWGPATLAYHSFWGEDAGTATIQQLIAILAYWHERYGAELVGNWLTMLKFVVERPPLSFDEAWNLAVEQDIIGPDTFARAGVPIRGHARALVGRHDWFLHNRP
jgi:hypothetical protein